MRTIKQDSDGRWFVGSKPLARIVWETLEGLIPKGSEIHHILEDPSDDNPLNLACLTKTQHSWIHNEGRHGEEMTERHKMYATRSDLKRSDPQRYFDEVEVPEIASWWRKRRLRLWPCFPPFPLGDLYPNYFHCPRMKQFNKAAKSFDKDETGTTGITVSPPVEFNLRSLWDD